MVTRVTNSMLSRTLLSNLSLNLNSMDKLQNQLASGRKYAHISDDPSALIYGQAARNKIARLSHFQSSVGTAQNWLTQAEAGVMELQKMTGNVYEELINAGGPKTLEDRKNIAMMVSQLRDHYLDTLNSSYGDRFVFAGYNTPGDYINPHPATIKPFTLQTNANGNTELYFNGFNVSQFDGMPTEFLHIGSNASDPAALEQLLNQYYLDKGIATTAQAELDNFNNSKTPPGTATFEDLFRFHQLRNDVISFDVGPGITMPVTMNGLDLIFFPTQDVDGNQITRNMFSMLDEVHKAINGQIINPNTGEPISVADGDEIHGLTRYIKLLQDGQNHLLVKTAEIGGRTRRLELLEARYDGDEINYESMRSDAEDAEIAEVIMYLKMAETVYQAALSAGARVIQPSLMDFLR